MQFSPGAFLITQPDSATEGDALIRNTSFNILFNHFTANSGRYALKVGLNNLATDLHTHSVNITFNRFHNNTIHDSFHLHLNARSTRSGVVIVSGRNIRVNQNWFDNPLTRVQIATHLANFTTRINASYNWFGRLEPVYDLNYFFTYRDKCNQQWRLVRDGVIDQANRANLAQIVYWPYACNENLWFHEASNNLAPPNTFDFQAVNEFGGVFDVGHAVLPVRRYTVTNDILVKPGAKLTIKAGTELRFVNGVGMLVLGELSVEGLAGSDVRFGLADQRLVVEAARTEMNERLAVYESSTMRMPVVVGNRSEAGNETEAEGWRGHEEGWWWMRGRELRDR